MPLVILCLSGGEAAAHGLSQVRRLCTSPEATPWMKGPRVVTGKRTKEMRWNHTVCAINPKHGRGKVDTGNKGQMMG